MVSTEASSTTNEAQPPATAAAENSVEKYKPRFVDIGINLTDPIYTGLYHGTQRHPNDLSAVIQRAKDVGCAKLIVTGSDLEGSQRAVELAKEYPGTIYATVGIHPCTASILSTAPSTLSSLTTLAHSASSSGHAVAFGEFGLDYDRLELCPKERQLSAFASQLSVAVQVQLPLFLHSRAAHADFVRLLGEREAELPKRGVVHSFTGTVEEMRELVERGWSIGVNGCSLKTTENCDVVKEIPLDRLHLETDGPWCEIRPSHASSDILKDMRKDLEKDDEAMGWAGWKSVKKEKWVAGATVKGRNEPCFIGRVAWAVAGIKGVSVQEVADRAWENSVRMFGLGEVGGSRGEGKENVNTEQ